MFSFIEPNWWLITLMLVTMAILYGMKYLTSDAIEGFRIENPLHGFEKMVVCPMLQNNIVTNSGLLEEFTEKHAATSIERTSIFIDTLKKHYTEHDCDAYFQSLPPSQEVKVEKPDDAQKS